MFLICSESKQFIINNNNCEIIVFLECWLTWKLANVCYVMLSHMAIVKLGYLDAVINSRPEPGDSTSDSIY